MKTKSLNIFLSYGHDLKKLHPCLIPYEDLSEEEKRLDLNTAMKTIKEILGLGYKIEMNNP
jgi:hypothetical protein